VVADHHQVAGPQRLADAAGGVAFLGRNLHAAEAFVAQQCQAAGKREQRAQAQLIAGRLALGLALRLALGEIATLVLDGQRAVPQKLLDLGFKFRYAELFYALRNLFA